MERQARQMQCQVESGLLMVVVKSRRDCLESGRVWQV